MSTIDLVVGIPPIVALLVGAIAWWLGKDNLMTGGIVSLSISALIAIFVIFIHTPSDGWLSLCLLIQYPNTLSAIIMFWSEPQNIDSRNIRF